LLFCFSFQSLKAQDTLSLKGRVVSKVDQSPLIGSTVALINVKDSSRSRYTSTALDGSFSFQQLEKAFYRLKITNIAYQPFQKIFR